MNHSTEQHDAVWPTWLRLAVVACAALILSACNSVPQHDNAPVPMVEVSDTLPAEAFTGPVPTQAFASPLPHSPEMDYASDPHAAAHPPALPQWKPPGIRGPWPADEYLFDGGDQLSPARALPDWRVEGLEQEDTIAHYDTLDGRRIVEPSNQVCIYAPRFAAVRRVRNLLAHEGHDRVAGVEKPTRLSRHDDLQIATTAIQPIQPVGDRAIKSASIYRERQQGGGLEGRELLSGFHDGFLPHENFEAIRRGVFDQAEKARLSIQADAAITWSSDQAVQIIIDGKAADVITGDRRPEVTYRIDEPESPELRIIKVASTKSAKPGETVDFTLRFDNTGDQTIGNVTVIDNLTTRLEYLPETQQCKLEAEFTTEENQVGSLALRWEIQAPLEPGQGGIIRFRCRVR